MRRYSLNDTTRSARERGSRNCAICYGASGRYQVIRERAAFSITSTLISDFAKSLPPARIRLSVSKT